MVLPALGSRGGPQESNFPCSTRGRSCLPGTVGVEGICFRGLCDFVKSQRGEAWLRMKDSSASSTGASVCLRKDPPVLSSPLGLLQRATVMTTALPVIWQGKKGLQNRERFCEF